MARNRRIRKLAARPGRAEHLRRDRGSPRTGMMRDGASRRALDAPETSESGKNLPSAAPSDAYGAVRPGQAQPVGRYAIMPQAHSRGECAEQALSTWARKRLSGAAPGTAPVPRRRGRGRGPWRFPTEKRPRTVPSEGVSREPFPRCLRDLGEWGRADAGQDEAGTWARPGKALERALRVKGGIGTNVSRETSESRTRLRASGSRPAASHGTAERPGPGAPAAMFPAPVRGTATSTAGRPPASSSRRRRCSCLPPGRLPRAYPGPRWCRRARRPRVRGR